MTFHGRYGRAVRWLRLPLRCRGTEPNKLSARVFSLLFYIFFWCKTLQYIFCAVGLVNQGLQNAQRMLRKPRPGPPIIRFFFGFDHIQARRPTTWVSDREILVDVGKPQKTAHRRLWCTRARTWRLYCKHLPVYNYLMWKDKAKPITNVN